MLPHCLGKNHPSCSRLILDFLFGRLDKDAKRDIKGTVIFHCFYHPPLEAYHGTMYHSSNTLRTNTQKKEILYSTHLPFHFISPDSAWIPPGPGVPIPTTNYPAPVLPPWAVVATHVATGATCHNQFVWQPTTKANPQRRMVFSRNFKVSSQPLGYIGISKNRGTPKWMVYNGNLY